MSADLRRPEDWASALGFTIQDPDGWRGRMAQDFNQPVTAEEFDRRAPICTISFHNNTWANEFPKAVDLPARRPTHTPESLEAIFDQVVDLVVEWHEADRYADNAPKSEREDARGLADERKDTVLQYLAQLLPAGVQS